MATNNSVNTSLAGQTGTGTFVGATSPTLVTPILGAASATSLTFSSTSGIIGTTTNNNAPAGSVGYFLNSAVASSPGVNIPTATATNVTSMSLPAGDWDVWGNINYVPSATIIAVAAILGTTSAAIPADAKDYIVQAAVAYTVASINTITLRISIAAPTTVYLIGYAVLSAGTCVAGGNLNARVRR